MSISSFVKNFSNIMRNDSGVNGDAQRIEQMVWILFLKVYDAKEADWEFDEDNFQSIIPENCRWRNWAVDDRSGSAMTAEELLDFINNTLFPTLKGLEVTPTTPIKKAIVRTVFEDANQYMKDGVLLRQVINVVDDIDFGNYTESHAFGDIYETILKDIQAAGNAGEFYTPRALTDFMAEIIQPKLGEKMADFACGTGGFITSWLKEMEKNVSTSQDQKEYEQSIYGIEKKPFPHMLAVTNLLLHNIDTPKVYRDNSLSKDVYDYTDKDKFDVILMNPPYGGSEKADVKAHFPTDMQSSETADLFMVLIMFRLKAAGRAAVIIPDGFLFDDSNAKVAIKSKLLRECNLHTIVRLPKSVFSPYTSIATNILFFDKKKADDAQEGFATKETWFYRLDMPKDYKNFSKTKPMKSEHCDPIRAWWNDRQEIIIEEGDEKARSFSAEELLNSNCDFDRCKFPSENIEILPPDELLTKYFEKRQAQEQKIDETLTQIQEILGFEIKKG